MEYTKDLILKVCYDEPATIRCFKPKNRTNRFSQKIKRHKIVTAGIVAACAFILIDGILLMNFIQILEML
ncbi:MAG: hypothetical protein HFJ28_03600 [Clostridia bacterium]|jgi:hypothetical protein|nr:hypothetical protein [Clostridia bacterium]